MRSLFFCLFSFQRGSPQREGVEPQPYYHILPISNNFSVPVPDDPYQPYYNPEWQPRYVPEEDIQPYPADHFLIGYKPDFTLGKYFCDVDDRQLNGGPVVCVMNCVHRLLYPDEEDFIQEEWVPPPGYE